MRLRGLLPVDNPSIRVSNNRALADDLTEQQRKRESSQALAQEGVEACMGFLNCMDPYYRGDPDAVQARAEG